MADALHDALAVGGAEIVAMKIEFPAELRLVDVHRLAAGDAALHG